MTVEDPVAPPRLMHCISGVSATPANARIGVLQRHIWTERHSKLRQNDHLTSWHAPQVRGTEECKTRHEHSLCVSCAAPAYETPELATGSGVPTLMPTSNVACVAATLLLYLMHECSSTTSALDTSAVGSSAAVTMSLGDAVTSACYGTRHEFWAS